MTLIPSIIFFVFGLLIGSFLSVVICRMNTGKSFGGRSACLSCQNKLRWHELIPLISFFVLRGRCRTCRTRISITYPLVEAATGLIFLALFLKFQGIFFFSFSAFIVTYGYYASIFSILVIIAAYDLRHKIIPDTLSLFLGVFSFGGLFLFSNYIFHPHLPSFPEFLSGLFAALPFAFFWLVSSGRWMGLGDAKLALGLGWFLGLSMAFSALAIAFWAGSIIGLCLIVFSRNYNMKSEIPFAFFLVFGAFFSFLFELRLFAVGF